MVQSPKVELWPLDRLVRFADNPRRHPPEQIERLRASIDRFGFVGVVLVDPAGVIVVGDGRVEAARLEGVTHVPVVRIEHLSAAEIAAYRLADNQLATLATWDDARLTAIMRELAAVEFDLPVIGFDDAELARLLGTADEASWPDLKSGDKPPFQQMTFTLADAQALSVRTALDRAKAAGPFDDAINRNSNGNALDRLARAYLGAAP